MEASPRPNPAQICVSPPDSQIVFLAIAALIYFRYCDRTSPSATRPCVVMRILKFELPATLASIDPNLSLASDELREQLYRELDALKDKLAEEVRQRAIPYFPPDFTVFVRFLFWAGENKARVILWIEDPTVRWPSGLLARRAWKLSIPIVTHIVKEVFEARVKSIRMDINERKVRVLSLAPVRGWFDPLVLTVVVTAINAAYWLIIHPWLWGSISHMR